MENKKFIIYMHINKINQKKYIGQTCQKPEYRWNNGKGYQNGSSRFWSAIKHYGWDNFEHKIIYNNLNQQEANEKEIQLIKKYNTTNPDYGYNLDSGGRKKEINEDTRKKQSISAQNRPPVTKETKEKLSKISKGKIRTEDQKEKYRQAAIERESQRVSKKIKVKCINTGKIFNSIREAADWCGLVGTSGISSVCKGGKQKTAGVHPQTKEKLKWEYA